MIVSYRGLLDCIEKRGGTQAERETQFIRVLNDIIFESRSTMTDAVYVRVCKKLRRAYLNEKSRHKLVRKIVHTIRKHESESRRSTKARAILDRRF